MKSKSSDLKAACGYTPVRAGYKGRQGPNPQQHVPPRGSSSCPEQGPGPFPGPTVPPSPRSAHRGRGLLPAQRALGPPAPPELRTRSTFFFNSHKEISLEDATDLRTILPLTDMGKGFWV